MRKIAFNEFEKSSLVTFSILMVANVCNYLYQIIMGNLLTTADYGTFNTLFSLTVILSVPAGIFQIVAAKYAAGYKTRNEMGSIKQLLLRLLRVGLFVVLLILGLGLLSAGPASKLLEIDLSVFLIAVVLTVALNCIISIVNGMMQGLKRFVSVSLTSVVYTVLKLGIGAGLVILGYGLLGSVAAWALSSIGVVLFGFLILRDILKEKNHEHIRLDSQDIRRYFHSVFWVNLMTVALSNGDILLVRAFASNPSDVGIYSSGMVIGKISLSIASAVIAVLFPMVAERQAQKADTRPLFLRALLFGGGLSGLSAVGIYLLGGPIIVWLFGERYIQASALQGPIGCFVVAISFVTILMNYVMARGETRYFAVSLGAGFVSILALVWKFHDTVPEILYIMSAVLALVFLVNVPNVLRTPAETDHTRLPQHKE